MIIKQNITILIIYIKENKIVITCTLASATDNPELEESANAFLYLSIVPLTLPKFYSFQT